MLMFWREMGEQPCRAKGGTDVLVSYVWRSEAWTFGEGVVPAIGACRVHCQVRMVVARRAGEKNQGR